jgi:hypothetical protein
MKKAAAIIASAALCMSMSVPAFADTTNKATVTDFEQSTDIDVNVKIDKTKTVFDTVYSVDLAWDSMDFTYQFSYDATMTWDPENHVYLDEYYVELDKELPDVDLSSNTDMTGYWTNGAAETKTSAGITVTNHSNASVVATAAFDNGTLSKSTNNVTASLNKSSFTLTTGEGRTPDEADKNVFTVEVSGRPNVNTDFNIGTVSITLSAN